MTAAANVSRARRGQMLIVDQRVLYDRLPEALQERIHHVRNLYEAVGVIANSPASRPIDAVVVHAGHITRSPEIIVESIRRLDPTVLLYLVVGSDDDELAARALKAGFDGTLSAPITPYMLSAIIGEEMERVEPAVASQSSVTAETTTSKKAPPARTRGRAKQPSPKEEPVEATPSKSRKVKESQRAVPVSATDERTIEPMERAPDTALGDMDLVEATLNDPERLPHVALGLLEQETGWRDVRLIPVESGSLREDERDRAAEVCFQNERFGWLISDSADPERLRPWADWLARWLSLAAAQHTLHRLAYTDPLTGAWNRRYFEEFLPQALERAKQDRRTVVLVAFDVDDLKHYNDRYGHDAGDDVLRETVRLLVSVIRRGDRVCRIGGDEFVIIFTADEPPRKPGSEPIESIEQIVRRFQKEICELHFPKLGPDAPGTLSISAGLATFPWDGHDAPTLLRVADQLAIESKRRGKNALTIGPGAAEVCGP